VAIDEPIGFAFKPVFVAGGLLLKAGGKKTLQESIEYIAKSGTADDIFKQLKTFVKGTDDELKPLAKQLVGVNDPQAVNTFINKTIDDSLVWAKGTRAAGIQNAGLKNYNQATKVLENAGELPKTIKTEKVTKDFIKNYYETKKPPVVGDIFSNAKGEKIEIINVLDDSVDYFLKGKKKGIAGKIDIEKRFDSPSTPSLGKALPERIPQTTKIPQTPSPSTFEGTAKKFLQTGSPLIDNTIAREASQSGAVSKITEALSKAESLLPKQKALYAEERARRAGAIKAIGEKVKGEEGYYQQLSQLKGELPKVQFESIRKQVAQSDVDELFNLVRKNDVLSEYEKISAQRALSKIVGAEGGSLPTKSEIEILREVFPKEFIDVLMKKRPVMEKLWTGAGEILNLPRAIMATMDLSAPLRQGVFLVGRPKQWIPAFKDMFKYAFNEKSYQGLLKDIKSRPTYELMRDSGLAITDIASTDLTKREEMFMSNLVEKIPIFGNIARGSNRAYSGFLTKLRADTFDSLIGSSRSLGIKDTRVSDDIAKFVNSATGRGDLGHFNRAAVVLNGALFSPRLMASRLNLLDPRYYYKLDPFVRKEAIKSLFTFAGIATTVAGLAHLAGAEVTIDPRNADFGKIKIGNTRLDPYGGFQQYIRAAAQLMTGKIISSTTGREIVLGEGYKALTRKDILIRFLESKEAPILSFVSAIMQGQNGMGEPINVPTEIISRMIPLLAQDTYSLYKENGIPGIAMAVPGLFGVGSQTYGQQELVTGKNKIGAETAQIQPVGGLAEDINDFLFGSPDLGPSSSTNVEKFYDQMLEMPKVDAAKKFEEIRQLNPELAKKIVDVVKEREMGITIRDKELKSKGVANGDRASAIIERLSKLKTNEEKGEYWNELVRKKVITPEVSRQLNAMLKQ
jgi:hypothetical protein